ncbi:MAG: hypothetical protein R6V54_03820, partial [Desulfobacteraceae bacterium]
MGVKRTITTAVWAMLTLLFLSGTAAGAEEGEEKTSLFVSIAPQAYLAKQIGREKVAVNVL